MYYLAFPTAARSALLDIVGQIRNPLTDANAVAGPTFGKLGAVVGALNNQVYAGANTVSSMMDGYKELEKTNPNAPIVKAMTTFSEIFTDTGGDPNAAQPQGPEQPLPPAQLIGQKFDAVKTFMGDGKEVINLNTLLGSVSGTMPGSTAGGLGSGIAAGLMPNLGAASGAQNLMTTGTKALFGVMGQLQNSMGPESQGNGRILPGILSLAKGGLASTAHVATNGSNVPQIAPYNPANNTSPVSIVDPNTSIHPQYSPSSTANLYPMYANQQSGHQVPQADQVNYYANPELMNSTTTATIPVDQQIQQLNQKIAMLQQQQQQQQQASQAVPNQTVPDTGPIASLTGNAAPMLNNLPSKAMEVFSLAQSLNSGDATAMSNSVTGLIKSAGSVLQNMNNARVQPAGQQASVPLLDDRLLGTVTIEAHEEDEAYAQQAKIYTLPDLPQPEIMNDPTQQPLETTVDPKILEAFNKQLVGDRADEVEPLPAWITASTRRLQETPLEPCYLVNRNLVGNQLTNIRAWNVQNCQEICTTTNLCKYWTFAPQIALCYMYHNVTGTIETAHTVSGPRVCPENTDKTVPQDAKTANDFLFGLAAPLQKLTGQSEGNALGPLQRLMTGAGGENIVSSVIQPKEVGASTYQMLGGQFADGFETGSKKILDSVPNVLSGILGAPDSFQQAAIETAQTDGTEARVLAPIHQTPDFLQRTASITKDDDQVIGGQAFPSAIPVQSVPTPLPQVNQIRYPMSSTPIPINPPVGQQQATGSSFGGLVNSVPAGQVVDVFDTSSSLARASTKIMDTIPMMDIAKAGFQLYNSGFFRSRGIFGGNSTGDKLSSLPPPNLGTPRVTCTWSGMQCCVPKASIPKASKKVPVLLNGVNAGQCQAIDFFDKDVEEMCVTIKFDDSSTSCNTSKSIVGDKTIYQATMLMPGKMNNGLCECILDKVAYQIDKNADWQVNIISFKETQEKEKAAEESADKVRKSASTAMAWTKMIADAAQNVGSAAFGTASQSLPNSDDAQMNITNNTLLGDNSKWSSALSSLASVRETVNQARGTVAGVLRRLRSLQLH